LRGLAAMLIVYYHGLHLFTYYQRFHQPFSFEHWLQSPLWFLGVLLEGHTAVALFMVLSGFIFTHGSLGKEVIYSKFIANRFLRTYPLFILLIFVGISAFPGQLKLIPLLQTVFGFANNFGSLQIKSFSSMFWAIAVEWHFYLVFPFLLLFFQRYGVRYLFGLMAVFLVFRVLAFYQGAAIRDMAYMTIVGRMDQFLLGMLVAVVYARGRMAPALAGALLVAALGGVMILLYRLNLSGGWPVQDASRIYFHTIEGGLWALVIYAYLNVSASMNGMFSRVLCYVGTISYSMYLIHFTIISVLVEHDIYWPLTGSIMVNALLTTTVIALPIILAVSSLTYYCVELPFLSMRVRYHKT
jgi:peptidoglycan/LPS O-acetylase OafA/YrhL